MKRIAIFAVLAAVLIVGVVIFMQQSAQNPPPETVAEAVTIVPATEKAPAAEVQPDGDTQPEMVEESAAEDAQEQSQDKPLLLARAEVPAASQEWKYEEGTHFVRMVPTQPTVGGADKIEVA